MPSSLAPTALKTLQRNLQAVRERMARSLDASHRAPGDVTLVVVTKAAPLAAVRVLADLGVRDIGENRVPQARARKAELGSAYTWHFIGHLQRNKAGAAIDFADLIHSIDSTRLLDAVDRKAQARPGPLDVLLEVNVSGEEAKHGFTPEETGPALRHAAGLDGLRVTGLMTMGPVADDPEDVRPHFAALRELRDDLNRAGVGRAPMAHLSMGMTQDFGVAVEEGATLVRVGSAIFKAVEATIAGEGQ
jgi:PLP dependent protein